jgi:hypothetical protein
MEINHKTQFLANIDNMPQTVEHVEIALYFVSDLITIRHVSKDLRF